VAEETSAERSARLDRKIEVLEKEIARLQRLLEEVLRAGTGVNNGEVRAANTAGRTDYTAVQQLPISVQIPTNPHVTGPSLEHVSGSVRISQGETLYRIGVKNLGRYDPQIVKEIRKLNP